MCATDYQVKSQCHVKSGKIQSSLEVLLPVVVGLSGHLVGKAVQERDVAEDPLRM